VVVGRIFEAIFEDPDVGRVDMLGPALFTFIATVIAAPNAGSALGRVAVQCVIMRG
jgi:hypothetical protein